ncbi:DUF4232 domain-containing protein [Streptomyces sp. NPDC005786]|uniref:DUF4232 domain-containing protein n=1 Tax=Streptomyces sp. NPDC005786 TaxID=3154891 RepID=UPI0033D48B88
MRSNRIRTTALAATALLAALSLTACSSDGGNSSNNDSARAGAAAPAAHTAVKQSQPSATAAPAAVQETPEKEATVAEPDGTPKRTAPPATSQGKKATGAAHRSGSTPNRAPVTCTGGNTETTVSKVSRPLNHLLLTLTNTGNRPCYAYYAPKLRFDDAQAVFPILEDSRPQAVVTLDPGQSAYAAIGLTGEPGAGPAPREATHLQVYFSGKSPEGSTGTPANLTLPTGTYWDDNGYVTYWQTERADALTY